MIHNVNIRHVLYHERDQNVPWYYLLLKNFIYPNPFDLIRLHLFK